MQIVWETQNSVIDQNNILHVLINNLRTATPSEILTPILSLSDNLLGMPIPLFKKKSEFWDSTQNTLNFGLGCSFPWIIFCFILL